LTFTTYLCW